MKRIIRLCALLLPLLAVSCHKEEGGKKSSAPAITWESNTSFATVEIADGLDAQIRLSAEGAIDVVKVTVVPPSADYISLLNAYVTVQDNKGSTTQKKNPVFEVTADAKAASALKTSTSIRGTTEARLNLQPLLGEMIANTAPSNDSKFSFGIALTDAAGKSVNKTAVFRWTAAPEITWPKNTSFSVKNVDEKNLDANLSVVAPGKVAGCTIRVETPTAELVKTLNGLIGVAANQGSNPLLDLIGDSMVATVLGGTLPTGDKLKDKTTATLDLSQLVKMIIAAGAASGTDHKFTVTVTDANGRSAARTATFHVK